MRAGGVIAPPLLLHELHRQPLIRAGAWEPPNEARGVAFVALVVRLVCRVHGLNI